MALTLLSEIKKSDRPKLMRRGKSKVSCTTTPDLQPVRPRGMGFDQTPSQSLLRVGENAGPPHEIGYARHDGGHGDCGTQQDI